jgi:hypothetical protein
MTTLDQPRHIWLPVLQADLTLRGTACLSELPEVVYTLWHLFTLACTRFASTGGRELSAFGDLVGRHSTNRAVQPGTLETSLVSRDMH